MGEASRGVAVLEEALAGLALVDQHCRPVVAGPLDDTAFETWLSDSHSPPPPGTSYLDSQVGLAVRRWCAPVLGLPADASMMDYLAVRRDRPATDVNQRLLRAANLRSLLVDTAPGHEGMLNLGRLGEAAGAGTAEIVALEALAERIAGVTTATWFPDAFTAALASKVPALVAVKSMVAHRYGLGVDPVRPSRAEVVKAAGAWLHERDHAEEPVRLTDPVLSRFLLWSAVDAGIPVQIHAGIGGARCAHRHGGTECLGTHAAARIGDPGLLQPFIDATASAGTPLVLLDSYPYHRQAGWLAHQYPHVYVDLSLSHLGARSTAVINEFLELTPFGKLMFSTNAFGLAEIFLVGAGQFRRGMACALAEMVADGAMNEKQAQRVAAGIGADNAIRLYGLTG